MFASKNATAGISNPRDGISWWAMNWRKKSWFVLKNIVCRLHVQRGHGAVESGSDGKGKVPPLNNFCNVGPLHGVHDVPARLTPHQALCWHVLAPFYTWRSMTRWRFPAGVLQRCDWKPGPSAPVYTLSIWIDPLRCTPETKNRNETTGAKTV